MEVIRKTISLEQGRARGEGDQYGTLTATSFYFKVQLIQRMDDMGLFTDVPFIAVTPLSGALTMGEKFLRPSGALPNHWYEQGGEVSGLTDSKLEGLRTYNGAVPYLVGFDIERENYLNYNGVSINGVSRVTSLSGDAVGYTFDAKNDLNIGTSAQTTGIFYREDMSEVEDGRTYMEYQSEGWNSTNTQLSAIVKEEYLMGITSSPEIENGVFIDRTDITVMEGHLRMSEVESLDHLVRYGNGYYNVVRQ